MLYGNGMILLYVVLNNYHIHIPLYFHGTGLYKAFQRIIKECSKPHGFTVIPNTWYYPGASFISEEIGLS